MQPNIDDCVQYPTKSPVKAKNQIYNFVSTHPDDNIFAYPSISTITMSTA